MPEDCSKVPRKGASSMPLSAEHMQKANRFFRLNRVVPDCP